MTATFVDKAAVRVRESTWLPVFGRAESVLDRVLSGVGLTFATWAFAASLAIPGAVAGWTLHRVAYGKAAA